MFRFRGPQNLDGGWEYVVTLGDEDFRIFAASLPSRAKLVAYLKRKEDVFGLLKFVDSLFMLSWTGDQPFKFTRDLTSSTDTGTEVHIKKGDVGRLVAKKASGDTPIAVVQIHGHRITYPIGE